jgi:hypothetical protein
MLGWMVKLILPAIKLQRLSNIASKQQGGMDFSPER